MSLFCMSQESTILGSFRVSKLSILCLILHLCSRENIINILKVAYLSQTQENLPIFGIAKHKALADFCTTEKDVSRGINRMPLVLARMYEEDIKFDKAAKPRS